MTVKAQAVVNENPFQAAQTKFDQLVAALGAEDLREMSHNEAEEFVLAEGREVMRRLLQGHLDMRSGDDAGVAVTGQDGVLRTHRRERSVPLRTVVGDVSVARTTYGARGIRSLAPLDAALNLPGCAQTFGVQMRVTAEIARGSYDEAVGAVVRQAGINLAKRQAESIARAATVDFDAFYAQKTTAPSNHSPVRRTAG